MGLTTSLFTGLSGLNANAQLISVTGNNIANVNTTGFKASRVNFQSEISETLAGGSAPTGQMGGTNPTQIGLGTRLGSIMRDFADGSLQPTGVNTEMAIEGNGFFVVDVDGVTRYTRAGNFKLDNNFNLVSPNGAIVQGYGIDKNFKIVTGSPQGINIPVGNLTLAEATKNTWFSGNLNANGNAATHGAVITTGPFYADATQTTLADAATPLDSLYNASGAKLFTTGDVLTLTGATKGSATLPDQTFQVGATNTTNSNANGATVADLMTFFQGTLGIDTNITGTTAGVTITNGVLRIEGNTGSVSDIGLADANLIDNMSANPTLPFSFNKTQSADGESVRTTFVAYDSLGTPVNLDLSVVLESKTANGTNWRFYAQSGDDSDLSRVLGNGTLNFGNDGQLETSTGTAMSIDRLGTGAASPQQITLHFDQPAGAVSALTDVSSQISALNQDGTAKGTLSSFSVNTDGHIVGVFTNSQTRDLGQVILAKFSNPDGLTDAGNNLFAVTSASGDAAIVNPGGSGAGKIIGGALEQSNVDLSAEFINLISASTGFSANSRVLTTSDRLIQDLLTTIR